MARELRLRRKGGVTNKEDGGGEWGVKNKKDGGGEWQECAGFLVEHAGCQPLATWH